MIDASLQIAKFEANVGDQRLAILPARLDVLQRKGGSHRIASVIGRTMSFSEWIYRIEHASSEQALVRRLSFLGQARKQISNVLDRIAGGEIGDWDLVTCDDGTSNASVFEASVLTRSGNPIRVRPDAVFEHRRTGLIVVFEYKIPTPGVHAPLEGWPNMVCQLWTYAWIDQWASSPNVLLVGVVFDWNGLEAKLTRVWPRTVKTDVRLNAACVALFRSWGGEIISKSVTNPSLRRLLAHPGE